MPAGDQVLHHGSHRRLLSVADDRVPAGRDLDAIVVPTTRAPAQLAEAGWLARALDCPLVTLHSEDRTAAAVARQHVPASVDLIAIAIKASDRLHLPGWATSRLLHPTFTRRNDVSAKRNLALLLSHLLGWSRVLFLDDDITGLNPADIRQAGGLLDTHNAVGLQVTGFPDHSVVCHAYLRAGGSQQSFIGGGALAVAVQRCDSFFPDVYNDDWLFMLGPDGRLQPITVAGQVHQQPHDPFRDTNRAVDQEFGDVLGEGLYWLLDHGESISSADEQHWAAFLVRRRRFIQRVQEMTSQHDLEDQDMGRRIDALQAALGRLEQIKPRLCADYVQAWWADRERWREHVRQLPTVRTRQRALELLSRPGSPPLAGTPAANSWCRPHEPPGGLRAMPQ